MTYTHPLPEIDVYGPTVAGWTGTVDRDQLSAMSDAEILADLQNPRGWSDGSAEQSIAPTIYAVSTAWRNDPTVTVLKCRGTGGDFIFTVRG